MTAHRTTPLHARDLVESARMQAANAYQRLADAAALCAAVMHDPGTTPDRRDQHQRTVLQRSTAVRDAEDYYAAVRAGAARASAG